MDAPHLISVFTALFAISVAVMLVVSFDRRKPPPDVIHTTYTPPPSRAVDPIAGIGDVVSPQLLLEEDRLRHVTLDRFEWKREGFGAVAVASFDIRNVGEQAVWNVEIACSHLAQDGSVVSSASRQTFERVEPHGAASVRGLNLGLIADATKKITCRIGKVDTLQGCPLEAASCRSPNVLVESAKRSVP